MRNPIDEAPFVSTNGAAQDSLTAIEVLELCKDNLLQLDRPGRLDSHGIFGRAPDD